MLRVIDINTVISKTGLPITKGVPGAQRQSASLQQASTLFYIPKRIIHPILTQDKMPHYHTQQCNFGHGGRPCSKSSQSDQVGQLHP